MASHASPGGTPPRWWKGFLIGLFAASVAWRGVVLARLAGGPLLAYLGADSLIYWGWSGEIGAGQWMPAHPFFLGPLYPYWLALVRAVLGDHIPPVLGLQIALGALSVLLVTDATRRIATPHAAAIVGVLLAGYGMAVFFDLLILMESLLYFLGSLALWLMIRDHRHSPMLVGAVIGLMSLGRPTFVLLLLPYGFFLVAKRRPHALRVLGSALLVPIALAALTGFHHLRVTGTWIPFTYSGGFNFYIGNGPAANGTFVSFADAVNLGTIDSFSGGSEFDGRSYLATRMNVHVGPAESSRYWSAQTWAHVTTHPWRTARLLGRKLLMLYNHRELPQIVDAAAYDRAAGPFGWPSGMAFAMLAMVGAMGLIGAWRGGPEARLVLGCLFVLTIATAAFFVVDRYRIQLVPLMAVLAGLGLERLRAGWSRRDRRGLARAGGAAACAAVVVFTPVIPADRANADWGYATTLGEAWLAKGDLRQAVAWLEEAAALDRSGALHRSQAPEARLARASTFELLGIAHARAGDPRQALASMAAAVRIAPEALSTRLTYADQLAFNGAFEEARQEYRVVGVSRREAANRLVAGAVADERRGDTAGTRVHLMAAVGLDPGYEPAVIPLVRLDIMDGALDAALGRLRDAESHGLDAAVARAHEAWISIAQGDTAAARRAVESIPATVRASDPRVSATLQLLRDRAGWRAEP